MPEKGIPYETGWPVRCLGRNTNAFPNWGSLSAASKEVSKVEERNGVIGIKINSLFDCLVWNGIF